MGSKVFRCNNCNTEDDRKYLKYCKKEELEFLYNSKTDDYICPYCLKNEPYDEMRWLFYGM